MLEESRGSALAEFTTRPFFRKTAWWSGRKGSKDASDLSCAGKAHRGVCVWLLSLPTHTQFHGYDCFRLFSGLSADVILTCSSLLAFFAFLILQSTEVGVSTFILCFGDGAVSSESFSWTACILHAFRSWSNRVSYWYVWHQRQWGCPVLAGSLLSGPTARGQQCHYKCWLGDVMIG